MYPAPKPLARSGERVEAERLRAEAACPVRSNGESRSEVPVCASDGAYRAMPSAVCPGVVLLASSFCKAAT
eukprot:412123-Rhodomonas_salina.4